MPLLTFDLVVAVSGGLLSWNWIKRIEISRLGLVIEAMAPKVSKPFLKPTSKKAPKPTPSWFEKAFGCNEDVLKKEIALLNKDRWDRESMWVEIERYEKLVGWYNRYLDGPRD